MQSVAGNAAEKIRQDSALNPALWLCGIVMPIGLAGAYLFGGILQAVFAIVAVLPVIVACGGFVYLLLNDPDRLQSEDYQIKHETISTIITKGIEGDWSEAAVTEMIGTIHQLRPGDPTI